MSISLRYIRREIDWTTYTSSPRRALVAGATDNKVISVNKYRQTPPKLFLAAVAQSGLLAKLSMACRHTKA